MPGPVPPVFVLQPLFGVFGASPSEPLRNGAQVTLAGLLMTSTVVAGARGGVGLGRGPGVGGVLASASVMRVEAPLTTVTAYCALLGSIDRFR